MPREMWLPTPGGNVMHEAGLMQEILTLAEAATRERRATRILRICLRIGPLSGVEPEALRFAFVALKEGTMAAAANLELISTTIRCDCSRCGASFAPTEMVF